MVIISIEEAIEREITLEAIIDENFSNSYNNNFNNSNFQQQEYQNNETTITSGGHIETTAFSKSVCYSCGYPNHTSRNCEARGKKQYQRWTNTVQLATKKLITPHTSASPGNNINLTLHTTDNILATSEQITHTEKTLPNNNEIKVILHEGENLMNLPLKFENKLRRRALIDTGACANAMPADFYKKLKEESPNSISELQQASFLNVKLASGRTVKVLAQVDVKFKVSDHNFQDSFLILPSMNSVVLGNPFFKKYNIEIGPGENLLKLSEMTYQLNEIRIPKEGRRKIPKVNIQFLCSKKQLPSPKIKKFSSQK